MTVWGRLTGLASCLYIFFFPVLEVPNIEQRDKMEKLFFCGGCRGLFLFWIWFILLLFFCSLQPCIHSFCAACYSQWMDRSSDCPSVRHKCSSTKAVAVALLKLLICIEISSQVSSSVDNTCVHVHLEGGSGVRLFLTFDKMQDSPSNYLV